MPLTQKVNVRRIIRTCVEWKSVVFSDFFTILTRSRLNLCPGLGTVGNGGRDRCVSGIGNCGERRPRPMCVRDWELWGPEAATDVCPGLGTVGNGGRDRCVSGIGNCGERRPRSMCVRDWELWGTEAATDVCPGLGTVGNGGRDRYPLFSKKREINVSMYLSFSVYRNVFKF